jgi:hypothetical protein
MTWEVHTDTTSDGWVNIWDHEARDGRIRPTTFGTREEAQDALDDYLEDLEKDVQAGNIEDYDPADFCVRYVPDVIATARSELLSAALSALNQIPNTSLNHQTYRKTYDLAAAIERHLKETAGAS